MATKANQKQTAKPRYEWEEESSSSPSSGEAVRDYFSLDEIFQRVAASADEEFSRPIQLLFMGGLAAGLSIGLSFYARAAITAQVPDAPLVGNLLYPIGFLLIVIGRYQLFTENTLTPVTLVLTRLASIPALLRNWGIVLLANIVGAIILAFFLAATPIFTEESRLVAIAIGQHALETPPDALFFKGIMAGWLVASMVWLIHAARDTISRIILVFFIMYLVPSADLFHCIIGICEAMYMFFIGQTSITHALFGFFLPVLLGNTVGGVLLVAILNYSQVSEDRFPERDCGTMQLTWREWLFEMHTGGPEPLTNNENHAPTRLHSPVKNSDHVLGNPAAPITLVHYGDFECPTSKKISDLVMDLQHHIEEDTYKFVFRHLPLRQVHPHAMNAAKAAEAAEHQGRFWDMADKLFQNPEALEEDDMIRYARELNLDIEQFEADFQADETKQHVEEDRRDAIRNHITTTGNLFINGGRYSGAWDMDHLLEAVHRVSLKVPRLDPATYA